MIKPLPHYIITEIMHLGFRDWQDIDINNIIYDFTQTLHSHGLDKEVSLDYGADWQIEGEAFSSNEGDLIDLQLYHEGDFRCYISNFYITWQAADGWSCTHFWFSGYNDDDEQEHWNWDNI